MMRGSRRLDIKSGGRKAWKGSENTKIFDHVSHY